MNYSAMSHDLKNDNDINNNAATPLNHIVLLGDSIFDNGFYTAGGPAVIDQVQALLRPGEQATLLAVDGNRVRDVERQLLHLSSDATSIFISVGGNDALDHIGILSEQAMSFAQVFDRLADIGDTFGAAYHQMLKNVLQHQLPTTVCTIYDGNFEQSEQRLVSAALATFNDRILREAFAFGLPVIDLRLVCHETSDYANEIEPSSQGGAKIARAINSVSTTQSLNLQINLPISQRRSTIYVLE